MYNKRSKGQKPAHTFYIMYQICVEIEHLNNSNTWE